MSIKFKPQYIYEEVLYEKNSEENCPKSLTLMLDKFCKSHNAVDEICLQEHGYIVLLGILFYSSIITSPVTTLLVGFKTASWLSRHLEVVIYFFLLRLTRGKARDKVIRTADNGQEKQGIP